MGTEVKFVKIGNSLSIRIPKAMVDQLHLNPGTFGDLVINGDDLVVHVRRPKLALEDLLGGITDKNMHSEVSTGQPQGAEASF